MVEQRSAGKLVSSPKPPEAGAQRAKLYASFAPTCPPDIIIPGCNLRWTTLTSVSEA
jgi:hypothetical protein